MFLHRCTEERTRDISSTGVRTVYILFTFLDIMQQNAANKHTTTTSTTNTNTTTTFVFCLAGIWIWTVYIMFTFFSIMQQTATTTSATATNTTSTTATTDYFCWAGQLFWTSGLALSGTVLFNELSRSQLLWFWLTPPAAVIWKTVHSCYSKKWKQNDTWRLTVH